MMFLSLFYDIAEAKFVIYICVEVLSIANKLETLTSHFYEILMFSFLSESFRFFPEKWP